MKLSTKLFLLIQVPTGLLLIFFGYYVVSHIDRLTHRSGMVIRDNLRSVLAAQKMNESLERLDSAALRSLCGRWDDFQDDERLYKAAFEKSLKDQEANITEPGESGITNSLRILWNEYQVDYATYENQHDPSQEYYQDKLYPRFVGIKKETERILDLNQDAMLRKSKNLESQANDLLKATIATSGMLIVLFLVWSGWQIRRLLRPLTVLSQAVRRVGKGDWMIRVPETGNDEITKLTNEFNRMTEHLEEYRSSSLGDMLRAKQMSQAAIDSLPDPVLIFGTQGEMINWNSAAESMLGIQSDAQADTNLPPEWRQELARIRNTVLSGHGLHQPRGYGESLRFSGPRDSEAFFLLRGHPLYGENGEISGVTVLCQDITKMHGVESSKINRVTAIVLELKKTLISLETALHVCLNQNAGVLNDTQAEMMLAARNECQKMNDTINILHEMVGVHSD